MRSFKKKTLACAVLATGLMSYSALSHADYFVISYEKTIASNSSLNSTLSESKGCVDAPQNQQWCLPVVSNAPVSILQNNTGLAPGEFTTKRVELDTFGLTANEVAELLTKDGRFGLVEVDPIVTTPTPPPLPSLGNKASQNSTNDPSASETDFYMGSIEDHPVALGIYQAWKKVGYEKSDDPMDVVVLDSSFFINEDIPYAGGRNFSTTRIREEEDYQSRSDNFLPDPQQVEEGLCTGHGLGVASVIGSTINNGLGVAGITNDVDIHAIRTLSCGSGFISDSIDAISWVLGDEFRQSENVTPYDGDVGVINISLSARSETCPIFAQRVIDKATEAGWTIVAAASNDYGDVTDYIPANCDNVITVGAVDRVGNRAVFSNVGEEVDFMAPGIDIAGVCSEDSADCYWQGTSFSTPLIAGMMAVLKKNTDLPNETLISILELSSNKNALGEDCPDGECGAGVPNLNTALSLVQSISDPSSSTIKHSLSANDDCEASWLIDNFGDSIPLCERYTVTFAGGVTIPNASFELVSKERGTEWGPEMRIEGQFNESVVQTQDINADERDYGYRMCPDNVCLSSVNDMDITGALERNKPESCRIN